MKDLQMRTNLSHNKQLSLGLYSVPTNELMAFQYKARKVDSKYFAESSPTFNQHFFLINIFDFMTCYLCILANLLLSENESIEVTLGILNNEDIEMSDVYSKGQGHVL